MTDKNATIQISKYPSLNGLRAISILFVIFDHINMLYGKPSPLINQIPFLTDGSFGVTVFFVISGFLISSLLLKEEFYNQKISLKKFYIRRTLRIFPAYYSLLLFYFILTRFHYIQISNASWLTAITYTKYFNWQLDWFTAHAWSLSIEEHFYLLWPLCFLIRAKTRHYFLIAVILLVPLFRILFYYYPKSWGTDLSIFQRLDAIAIGCLFALYQDKIIKKLSTIWKPCFYVSLLLLLLLPFINGELNMKHNLHIGFFLIPFGGTNGTVACFLVAIIMMFSVFGTRGLWFSFLNTKIMNQIGILSYSIYLWQQFFTARTNLAINQFPYNIILLIIAVLVSYYLIEKPFLRLKSKFSV